VFINAWSEWAEGEHLDQDPKSGRGRLEAVGKARTAELQDAQRKTQW